MKRLMNIKSVAIGLGVFLSASAYGREWIGGNNNNTSVNTSSLGTRAADCAPATSSTKLEFNNVEALIENSGLLWLDRSAGAPAYKVPKTGDASPIFAGALWMGGKDVNDQIKLAAQRFRDNGDDFWPGPLGGLVNPGDGQGIRPYGGATTDQATCAKWDNFYEIRRADVEQFVAWFECGQDPLCDQSVQFPNYQVPDIIKEWGEIANGNVTLQQDQYLAPFKDVDNDGFYDYTQGDYPWYDIKEEVDCRTSRQVTLFGDYTIWWIFNDVGNIHTETQGDEIGMEIRAQAFAFATNDEVNNMTFYNYELVNRSSNTLFETYFAQYVDADLGCAQDDYVGCDVSRGLGYAYNGDEIDDNCSAGSFPYGANPPAIGVDFFEGPYQDNNNIADEFYVNGGDPVTQAVPGNGIGYGDNIVDNERFGMRKFVYYNNANNQTFGDPDNFLEYYNYLSGRWKDGQPFVYGGTGVPGSSGSTTVETDFCFPSDPVAGGTTDPEGWGTGGVLGLPAWSEVSENNPTGDRRFVQSAGPFTLLPGALNNITVGVVYARGSSGNLSSIDRLRFADDKAQRLFDNCFQILEGPDAPQLTIQELDKELILTIDPYAAGNDIEAYVRRDPNIVIPADAPAGADDLYRFEGYQIFQMLNEDASVSDIGDIDKARLVAQVDLDNDVTQLINWELDNSINAEVPREMVNGNDEGLRHTFRVTRDLFAQGDDRLINHKKYYYIAIAYGYNNFKTFDPSDPNQLDGQKMPYIPSRTSFDGTEIKSVPAIPHIPTVENGGTVLNAQYGDGVEITRIEGTGNGGNELDLTEASLAKIVTDYRSAEITYKAGKGPIDIKIVDPLNVISDEFEIRFLSGNATGDIDTASWELTRLSTGEVFQSNNDLSIGGEQYFPDFGFSVSIKQFINDSATVVTNITQNLPGPNRVSTELINWDLQYPNGGPEWLSGFFDGEGLNRNNWIRSGTQLASEDAPFETPYNDWRGLDNEQQFEAIFGGSIAPWRLMPFSNDDENRNFPVSGPMASALSQGFNGIQFVNSVDLVYTPDKSKWTRCVVLEAGSNTNLTEGNAQKLRVRQAASVDKNGNTGTAEANVVSSTGMSWFPGYAIDIETGERLNIAFAEDSYLANDNGRDMIFNPTSKFFEGNGSVVGGGKHWVFVFRNNDPTAGLLNHWDMKNYDGGQNIYDVATDPVTDKLWSSCMWVHWPMVTSESDFLSSEVKLKLRVTTPYRRYSTQPPFFVNYSGSPFTEASDNEGIANSQNDWRGLYRFSTAKVATQTAITDTAKSELDLINVVPNPYYAYSNYERTRLDNVVKFTNLPDQCTIKIYTVNGSLIRTFTKDDNTITSIDWDLKNFKGVPIAGGVYLIHVNVPNVGEKILKWFGTMRPPDLQNF